MLGHTLQDFISNILLHQLNDMVYGSSPATYLAYGQIACGIELLGACRDSKPFEERNLSACRFEIGINSYMQRINPDYLIYNGAPAHNLYKHLRCGMSHLLRPQGGVGFVGRGNAAVAGHVHLTIDAPTGKLVLIAEDFFDDFEAACQIMLGELVAGTLTHPKLSGTFLGVN